MPRTQPFDEYSSDYEAWFDRHPYVYRSEVAALRGMLPRAGRGVEIGVGSGRFAAVLGISEGVEPSEPMRRLAARAGVRAVEGVAEALPYRDESFDFALMVTTICFVDDVYASLDEVRRILRPGGTVVIGLVDRDSPLGRTYERLKDENRFYRVATFYSTDEVKRFLQTAGFENVETVQTVFGTLDEIDHVQAWRTGYGEGGFVVLRATRPRGEAL
jgi:SAM-dependent methyltransferase